MSSGYESGSSAPASPSEIIHSGSSTGSAPSSPSVIALAGSPSGSPASNGGASPAVHFNYDVKVIAAEERKERFARARAKLSSPHRKVILPLGMRVLKGAQSAAMHPDPSVLDLAALAAPAPGDDFTVPEAPAAPMQLSVVPSAGAGPAVAAAAAPITAYAMMQERAADVRAPVTEEELRQRRQWQQTL